MKKIFIILVAITALTACKKKEGCTDSSATNYDKSAEKSNNSCTYKGTATFWIKNTSGIGNVNVTLNGTTSVITASYTGSPACSATGCASFQLAPGTYYFSAQEQGVGGATWSGNVDITSNGCTAEELF